MKDMWMRNQYIYNTNWFHLFWFSCACLTVILAIILMSLFLITLRKVILKAGDLEHRCVRCKGSSPQRHSNWLKETPLNGAAEDTAFVHLFVSSLPCDSLFNFWSLECLYFISTCTLLNWNWTRRELVTRWPLEYFIFCFVLNK